MNALAQIREFEAAEPIQHLRMVQGRGLSAPRHPFRRERAIMLSRRWIEQQEAKRRRDKAVTEMIARVTAKYEQLEPVGPQCVENHPQRIIATIETLHGIEPGSIVAKSRSHTFVPARYDAIVAVYQNCRIQGRPYTLQELGRVFNRDHTVCHYALRQRGVK